MASVGACRMRCRGEGRAEWPGESVLVRLDLSTYYKASGLFRLHQQGRRVDTMFSSAKQFTWLALAGLALLGATATAHAQRGYRIPQNNIIPYPVNPNGF